MSQDRCPLTWTLPKLTPFVFQGKTVKKLSFKQMKALKSNKFIYFLCVFFMFVKHIVIQFKKMKLMSSFNKRIIPSYDF